MIKHKADMITAAAVAARLDVTAPTVYIWASLGIMPEPAAYTPHGLRKWARADIEAVADMIDRTSQGLWRCFGLFVVEQGDGPPTVARAHAAARLVSEVFKAASAKRLGGTMRDLAEGIGFRNGELDTIEAAADIVARYRVPLLSEDQAEAEAKAMTS